MLKPFGLNCVTSWKSLKHGLHQAKRFTHHLQLRPYQQECLDTILDRFQLQRRAAVSLPTGSGKTVVFSKLVSLVDPLPGQGSKTLILTNRRELCYQTAHTLQAMYPNMHVALEIGSLRFRDQKQAEVCVASVASISRDGRLEEFNPKDFKMIIVDEAHHTAANTYKKVLDYFGADRPDCPVYLVGFSATFFRHDSRPLSHYFDDVFFHRHVESMIESGHLCRAKVTNVRAFGGELQSSEKVRGDNHVLKSEPGIELIVNLWKEHSSFKSTVIFAMDVDQAERLVSRFRELGVDCRAVHGNMRTADRDLVISDFKNRAFPVVVNCGVLTEGTDIPCIDQVILARPIASVGLAMQMIGRGLRNYPGKNYCHIIQLVELTNYAEGFDLAPILAGVEPRPLQLGEKEQNRPLDPGNTAQLHNIELDHRPEYTINDIFKAGYEPSSPNNSPLHWVYYQKRWYLFGPPSLGSIHYRIIKAPSEGAEEPAWLVQQGFKIPIKGKAFKVWKYFDKLRCVELKDAIQKTEQLATEKWGKESLQYMAKSASWRGLEATSKQIDLLKRDKSFPVLKELCPNLTRGVATTLINFKVLNCNLKPSLIRAAM